MYFRLTYEGDLLSTQDNENKDPDKRRFQKHHLRRWFHPQLRYLWETHPVLKQRNREQPGKPRYVDQVASEKSAFGYNYVPLVKCGDPVICRVETLFLRRQMPGGLIQGGDLDNRIKSLYDGLRMPRLPREMRDIPGPDADERPFFCLFEDDSLITHTAVETDVLTEMPKDRSDPELARVRLIITVTISPYGSSLSALEWV